MSDKIILTGLEVFGRHGCSEFERKQEQLFIVDTELEFDLSRAGKTDDLGDTIDYVAVLDDIKKIVGGTSRNLIETVAQDICNILLKKYLLLDAVKIILRKPAPPIDEAFLGAAVELYRRRNG